MTTLGYVTRAKGNGAHCGDQCAWWEDEDCVVMCLADGLGHGPNAEEAAVAAIAFVGANRHLPLPELFTRCDAALRQTRGVAMAVAVVDIRRASLTYAAIGNIRCLMRNGRERRLGSDFGIIGAGFRHLAPDTVALSEGNLIVLASDGVEERLTLSRYGPDLLAVPSALAEAIIEDWNPGTDDAAALVCRFNGGTP